MNPGSENYQDFLKEIAEEALKELLISTLKNLATSYVVRKLGAKVIPLVNVVAGVKSLIDAARGEDTVRDSIAVNCVRLYLKGSEQDDRTLSVKILANILGDAFEKEIKDVIVKKALDLKVKLIKRVKPVRTKNAPVSSDGDPPKLLPEPATTPAADTAKPKTEQTSGSESETIRQGIDTFRQTYKPPKQQRATDNKANNKPEEIKPGKDASSKAVKSHEEDEEKAGAKKAGPKKVDKRSEDENDREVVNRKTSDSDRGSKGEDKKPKRGVKEGGDEEPSKAEKSTGKPTLHIEIHTSASGFNNQLVSFFRKNPKHPLIAFYDAKTGRLNPSTKKGMDEFYWHEHPQAAQAGHVTSRHTGARDKIVIMTAYENQMLKSTIEGKGAGASIRGGFQVAIIEGIPISVESAKHMIAFGKLDPKALEDAHIVDVDDL